MHRTRSELRRGGAAELSALAREAIVLALLVSSFWSAGLTVGVAQAQQASTDEVREMLDSPDAARIQQGIETAAMAGTSPMVELLATRIRRGLPANLLEMAVESLGIMSRAEAGPVLFDLVSHRRVSIRLKAIEAIGAIRPEGGTAALVTALSDTDASVRSAAALSLGQLGEHDALDPLFHALDRGILEASTSIGQLARPADVNRLLAYLGRLPFDSLTPALLELLARRDVPDRNKLDVIARLSELATGEAKRFLQDFVASLPESRRRRDVVRQAAQDAIMRIAD